MSSGELHPSVSFHPRDTREQPNDDGSSFVDEGAILLKNQVNDPNEGEQNMASPSINAEPGTNRLRDGVSLVDMVLVYEVPDPSSIDDEKEQATEDKRVKCREFYLEGLKSAGLVIEIDQLGGGHTEVCYSFSVVVGTNTSIR